MDSVRPAGRRAGRRSSSGSTARSSTIVNSPEVREALDKQGVVIEPGSPAALAARIRDDMKKWSGVIAGAGVRAQ